MESKKIKAGGYDEAFKTLMSDYFSEFANVTTDYEIVGMPKKTDLLIVETDKTITDYVAFFTYFKRFNIVEFKSVSDPFRLSEDLFKLPIYIGGVVLKETEADYSNTTFTVVSSRKPLKLIKYYENDIKKVNNGLYLISGSGILPVDVYIVVIEEIDPVYEKEIRILKEFSTGKDKERFLTELLHLVQAGINQNIDLELWEFAIGLYFDEIKKLAIEEKIKMTLIEKNIDKWNEEFGLTDKYELKGVLKTAKKLLEKGVDIELIMEVTELTREQIEELKEK